MEGYVQIVLIDQGTPKDYEDLSFPKLREITDYLLLFRAYGMVSIGKLFPNLAVIRGRVLFHNFAFVVYEMMQLQEIGLTRLTDIVRGSVRIEKNPNLCFADTIDWDRICKGKTDRHYILVMTVMSVYMPVPHMMHPSRLHFNIPYLVFDNYRGTRTDSAVRLAEMMVG